jgi:protocatechuate 3,4-dioxygenase beta subunit
MFAALAFTLVILGTQPLPQPRRDAAPGTPARSGTATLSGIVLTDDAEGKPVRRARVSMMDPERRHGATAITDDSGRFVFRQVPAGRYLLTPIKSAWVSIPYGAARPGRPGTPVTIAEGQQLEQLTLRIARGGVITGTVTDEAGRPLPRTTVTPFRYVFQNGVRTLVPSGSGSPSDDRGVYRIFGLAPGQYLVAARNPLGGGSPSSGMEIRLTTDSGIQRALAERGRQGGAADARQGAEQPAATVAYAPVFYPGTPAASQASVITVATGEERSGIDFPVSLVPTARVEGVVVDPDGAPSANGAVNIIASDPGVPGLGFESFRMGRTDADGRFSFSGLPPGRYALVSRAVPARDGPPREAPAAPGRPGEQTTPSLFATTEVALDGSPVTGLTMMLQPGFTIAGRLQFSGTLPPPDASRMRVQLLPVTMPGQVNVGVPPGIVKADGTFTISGIAPGTYRLSSTAPGARPDGSGWTLVSALANGRDMLDEPLDLRQSINEVVLVFSDRSSELSGRLQDPAGRPAPDHHIVLFAADRAHWLPQSRRIRALRPSTDGTFAIRSLPPGDYLLSAVTDIEPGEWFDPAVLQQLSAGSMKITLAEGEKKVQDVQVGATR